MGSPRTGLLPFFFGVALANAMRGVALGEEGYFFAPLWTDFDPTQNGITRPAL